MNVRRPCAACPVHRRLRPCIEFDASEAVQTLGADLYGQRCAMCHGRNAAGGGALADLRYAAPSTFDIFHNIVREGAYTGLGMPNLGAFLNEAEAEAIKQYILERRAALLEAP